MKPLIKIFFLVLANSFWWQVTHAQKVNIEFDYSHSETVLNILEARTVNPEMLTKLASLKSTGVLLNKVQNFDKSASLESLSSTLSSIKEGKVVSSDSFRWKYSLEKASESRKLLDEIKREESNLRTRLVDIFKAYLKGDQSFRVTVHFLIGGASAGFATDQENFYIGLQFYQGDIEGVAWMLQHELFHSLQFLSYKKKMEDLAKLNDRQRAVYLFAERLYQEGTATYVADVMKFPTEKPYIKFMQDIQRENERRMPDNFVLLDTIIFRLYHDSSVTQEILDPLGFSFPWKNPMYFAGYEMCKTIENHQGRGSIKKYLSHNPLVFMSDYIEAQQAAGGKTTNARFSNKTAEIVKNIEAVLRGV